MFTRVLLALLVLVAAAVVCLLLGGLLQTIQEATANSIGAFLKGNAGLIGFLCGIVWFIWGPYPTRRV